jgi:hypothetical protein
VKVEFLDFWSLGFFRGRKFFGKDKEASLSGILLLNDSCVRCRNIMRKFQTGEYMTRKILQCTLFAALHTREFPQDRAIIQMARLRTENSLN